MVLNAFCFGDENQKPLNTNSKHMFFKSSKNMCFLLRYKRDRQMTTRMSGKLFYTLPMLSRGREEPHAGLAAEVQSGLCIRDPVSIAASRTPDFRADPPFIHAVARAQGRHENSQQPTSAHLPHRLLRAVLSKTFLLLSLLLSRSASTQTLSINRRHRYFVKVIRANTWATITGLDQNKFKLRQW